VNVGTPAGQSTAASVRVETAMTTQGIAPANVPTIAAVNTPAITLPIAPVTAPAASPTVARQSVPAPTNGTENALVRATVPAHAPPPAPVAVRTPVRTPTPANEVTPPVLSTATQPARTTPLVQQEQAQQLVQEAVTAVNVQVNVMFTGQQQNQESQPAHTPNTLESAQTAQITSGLVPNNTPMQQALPSNQAFLQLPAPEQTIPSSQPRLQLPAPEQTIPSNQAPLLLPAPEQLIVTQQQTIASNETNQQKCLPTDTPVLQGSPEGQQSQESQEDQVNSFQTVVAIRQCCDWKMSLLAFLIFCVVFGIVLFATVNVVVDDKEFSTYVQKRCRVKQEWRECRMTEAAKGWFYQECANAKTMEAQKKCSEKITPTFLNKARALWDKYS